MFMERPEIDNIAADVFGGSDARRGIEVAFQSRTRLLPGDNLVLTTAFTGAKTGTAPVTATAATSRPRWLAHESYRFWSDGPFQCAFGATMRGSEQRYGGHRRGADDQPAGPAGNPRRRHPPDHFGRSQRQDRLHVGARCGRQHRQLLPRRRIRHFDVDRRSRHPAVRDRPSELLRLVCRRFVGDHR